MEICCVILDDEIQYENLRQYESLLPTERQEKIARYRFEKDKLRSLIAGLLIRRVTGGKPLIFGEHDKPYLADQSCFFSVSHSGDYVVIAVDDAELGADVELLPEENRLKIADRFYHPNERESVHTFDDPSRAFCRIWTRKEAYLKCTGEGISTDLTAFDTLSPPLCDRIATLDLDGCCLSVCSVRAITENDLNISYLELKELTK